MGRATDRTPRGPLQPSGPGPGGTGGGSREGKHAGGLPARLIDYLGRLPVTQGERAGQPFEVLPWERRFIRGAFRCEGDAALTCGRGNGKTGLISGLAGAAIDPAGPLHRPRSEVVVVASAFAQARLTFEDVLAALRAMPGYSPDGWRIQDSVNTASVEHRETGARLRCIGQNPNRAHGLRPSLILADEPAQWDAAKGERMIAALRTSLGKVQGSKLIAIGTRPAAGDHFYSRMLEEAPYAQTHAAGKDDPPFRVRTWRKANPSLDHFPALRARIALEAKDARRDAGKMIEFRALRLNQGVSDVLVAMLIDAGAWERCESHTAPDLNAGYVLGVDLGSSAAMSAAAAFHPATGALDCFAVFPEEPSLIERGLGDGVGNRYQLMHERGELLQRGRHVSDVKALLAEALRRWGKPAIVTCDRWRMPELREALEAVGFPRAAMAVRGMGWKDGGEDVRRFRDSVLRGQVHAPVSLLLRSAMTEARVLVDPAGNAKLAKGGEAGRRWYARDDAAAAAILAVAEGQRQALAPKARRVYHGAIHATA